MAWLGGWRAQVGGEEGLSLPGSVSQELEMSAMELSPGLEFNSGAISPADSGDGSVHGRA